MKKILVILIAGLMLFSAMPAQAADDQANLPTWFTYTKEWVVLNMFSWKTESKLTVLDRYATERVGNIKTASQNGADGDIAELADRYLRISEKEKNMVQEKNISAEKINMVMERELERQRILSTIRQETQSESVKNKIVEVQERAVENARLVGEKVKNEEEVKDFQDKIVSSWRDPKGEINANEEKATRVYAAGTSENGTIDDGIIIDGGEAKIVNENNQLKIEYAPGTGPSSVTTNSGMKLWKIVQSDGTTIESYQAATRVVIGQSTGVASNIVVNTVNGGTGTTANVVVGSGGNGGVTIVGGKKVIKTMQTGMESGGPVADPSRTTTNSLNGANSINPLNQTQSTNSGQAVQQVDPATPQTQE